MKRTELLNKLVYKGGYASYLEVGSQDVTSNFNQINVQHKVAVDPFPRNGVATFIGTSDEYFASLAPSVKFDLIFIDGLHHSDQVLKDIENSLNHLSKNGTIVCHDCLPSTEKMQERDDHGGEWTGDVWKAIAKLRTERSDLSIVTVDTDYGCGIIRKGTSPLYEPHTDEFLNYSYYASHKRQMLNVISVDTFATDFLNTIHPTEELFTVVIPTLWRSSRIHQLLEDLIECERIDEIILIDNNRKFTEYYTELRKVTVISPDENLYVNPAWNLGIRLAKNKCIVLANDDINFSTDIFDRVDAALLLQYGIIGMGADNFVIGTSEGDPELHVWEPGINDMGWGCLLLVHKSHWIDIPTDIKIWYGDNFIKDINPAPKAILRNFKVDSDMSTTSDSPEWDAIKREDFVNFMKVRKDA